MRPPAFTVLLALAPCAAAAQQVDLLTGRAVGAPQVDLLKGAPAGGAEVDLLKGSAALPAPRSPAVGPDGKLVLTPESCAALARLLPSGGAYQPGVDARGQAVAPADVATTSRPKFDDFPVEIVAPVPGGVAGTQQVLRLGFVTLRDNHAYFNGQPLTDPDQEQFAAACREQAK
jgi:hypothetical protein